MGRTMEALKQPKGSRRPAAAMPLPAAPQEGTVAPPASLKEETPAGDEVPFIEVGGPRSLLHASAAVLAGAAAAKQKPASPLPGALKPETPAAATAPRAVSPQPAPLTVAFQPLPLALSRGAAKERFGRELVAYHQPEHPLSEQYRSLVLSLTDHLPQGESHVLLLTRGGCEAGKTTVLLNLAISYAREGKGRVAVVDTGASQPSLAARLGLPTVPGLREVLTEAVPLQGALQETGQPELYLLSAGEVSPADRTWVASEAMRPVLQQLRQQFDLILVDGPAWDGGPGTAALGLACNAVYLVVRAAEAKSPEVEELMLTIPQRGSRLCGYILTQP